jgi:hypothetical protein
VLKNGRKAIILSCLFFIICPYGFTQAIIDNKIRDKWEEEWAKILEQAENYRAEQQARILTLSDLECTYWVPADRVEKRTVPWNFAFLNENFVLLLDSYDPDRIFPRYLIHYSIQDNIIFFTETMIGYLDNTYLIIGSEKGGFVRFELNLAFTFFDMLPNQP